MSELKKLLGKRIKEIRVERNLTQEDLSELTEIGASSISKIESGHFHPTDENLERIAKALFVIFFVLFNVQIVAANVHKSSITPEASFIE